MNRDEHRTYIRSSLANIMREVVCSAKLLGNGMEFSAVNGYLLQSLFLQMTGAQEQKMKCICWELATDDLNYRNKRYYNKGWALNQCSTLNDKTSVYEDLFSAINSREDGFRLFANTIAKRDFINEILEHIKEVFENTNIALFHKQKYESFKILFANLDAANIITDKNNIFQKGNRDAPISGVSTRTEVFAIYSLLYRHRNRCAHNTPSYQLNLPHLQELRDSNYQKYDNIFLFYAILLMIDEIFRRLYDKYEELRELDIRY